MRKLVTTAVAATLCVMTVSPAWAQSTSFEQRFEDEAGATLSLNYRVPLGGSAANAERPSYGVTLNWGYEEAPPFLMGAEDAYRPNVRLADLRFDGDGMQRAQVGGLNFARSADGELVDERLNMMDPKSTTMWIVTGVVVVGVAWWLISENDDDEEEDDD